MSKTAWMSRNYEKYIQCLACSHFCKILEGKKGICGVRKNENGELKLLVYGSSVSYGIDPIEKKPLFHFYPGASIFSFGTLGCNFSCKFCQNADISQYHQDEIINKQEQNLLPEDIVNYCLRNGLKFLAFTYNEPAIFFEYVYDTAKLAHEKGIKNVYVSNGFESKKALKKILPFLDAANIDLKSYNEQFYQNICGGHLKPVKENIKWLYKNKVWLEITTLIIPTLNDSEKELTKIAKFIKNISPDITWHLSRYFPRYKLDLPPTPITTLEKAYKIGKSIGLNYVYIGNVEKTDRENTYCPNCGKVLIERFGYKICNYLNIDSCPDCKCKINGQFI